MSASQTLPITEVTLCSSQENIPSPRQQNGESSCSPSLPTPSSQTWTKPRKAPTVTPRSFKRFFTPKYITEYGRSVGSSRKALRDITALGANRKRRRTPTKDSVNIETRCHDAYSTKTNKSQRYIPPTPDPSPDLSSPLKRIRKQSLEMIENDDGDEDFCNSENEDAEFSRYDQSHGAQNRQARQMLRAKYTNYVGQALKRETGGHISLRRTSEFRRSHAGPDNYKFETADFYTEPRDAHDCYNISTPLARTIPFCTASCKTNSLVAIGDEDGGVRLLESAKDDKVGFSKPWLTFQPHANAILDLDFSQDDLRLVTASGDQTSKIVDMPSQRVIYTMAGHHSSVKQARFQPGSSNVLATSSRDGNIQIWDLRCKGLDTPLRDLSVPVNPDAMAPRTVPEPKMTWARSVNTIFEAHAAHQCPGLTSRPYAKTFQSRMPPSFDAPSRTEAPGRRGDVSITTLAFLPTPGSHLVLSGSEANASVKLWDLRVTHNQRRSNRPAVPLSSTRQPESHNQHRHFGLTSLSLSGDGARLFALCRDNTVYAYSTSHLILGSAPELSFTAGQPTRPKRYSTSGREREGLGPLYGFRHPSFHATTFYINSAVRPAHAGQSELLAVGSSDGAAVVFPTDERYMNRHDHPRLRDPFATPTTTRSALANPRHRNSLSRSDSGLSGRLNDTIPIYQHGTALIRGHSREVTGLTWVKGGELVTVGDDFGVRCWREEDRERARDLRMGGETEGRRWGCGWAEVDSGWDDDEG